MRRAIDETQLAARFKRLTPRARHHAQTIVKPVEALWCGLRSDYFKIPLNLEEFDEYTKDKLTKPRAPRSRDARRSQRMEFERAAELRTRQYLRGANCRDLINLTAETGTQRRKSEI